MIAELMQDAVGRVFSGAQLLIFHGDRVLFYGHWGHLDQREGTEPVSRNTAFDLASLTKPMVTASLIMRLIHLGRLTLETKIADVLPVTADKPIGDARLYNLLNHSAGLAPWRPWGQQLIAQKGVDVAGTKTAVKLVMDAVYKEPVSGPPAYSDIGFILLGRVIEQLTGMPLNEAFKRLIADRLGLDLFFIPVKRGRPMIANRNTAATRRTAERGLIHGVVDDDNAFVLGGVAGHAGLFGSALACHGLIHQWIDCFQGRNSFVTTGIIKRFWDYRNRAGSFVLGFDTPSPGASSAGQNYPEGLVGHLGFTGTSFWIHPKTGLGAILLTNRVNLSMDNTAIKRFRPALHDLIWQRFG